MTGTTYGLLYQLREAIGALIPNGSHGSNASLSSAATISIAAGSDAIAVQAFTQNVRYTLDSTTPTASTGFQLKAGDPPVLIDTPSGVTLKVIEETASASVQYQCFKRGVS